MMNLLAILLFVSTATQAPNDARQDGVRVRVIPHSNVYSWLVTNESAPPITTFEVGQHSMYHAVVPPGWSFELEYGAPTFKAWADSPETAIKPGETGRFAGTVDIRGAILGFAPMSISMSDGDPPIVFQDIWSSNSLPLGQVMLVALLIGGLSLLHTFWTGRAQRPA